LIRLFAEDGDEEADGVEDVHVDEEEEDENDEDAEEDEWLSGNHASRSAMAVHSSCNKVNAFVDIVLLPLPDDEADVETAV
jgi:hypothetical protein